MSKVIESAVVFECASDQLLGIAHVPQSNAHRVGVVIVVGGPQYRVGSHRQFTLMARAFAAAGHPVLRFDYRGMGDSEGSVRAFDQVDDDIAAAIDALQRVAPTVDRVILWGLCDAASACMIYSERKDERVSGLVVANPWVRTSSGEATAYLKYYYLQRLIQKSFWKKVFGGAFNVKRSFGDFLGVVQQAKKITGTEHQSINFIERMFRGVSSLPKPVLLLLSSNDLTAKEFETYCGNTKNWADWRSSPLVSVSLLPRMDHTFSGSGDVARVSEICIRWAERA